MRLEDQVCSLEYAKRLKELGVKQESLFYYRAWENPLAKIFKESDVKNDLWILYYYEDKHSKSCDWEISAYTVAELGEFLPATIKKYFTFTQIKYYDEFVLSYDSISSGDHTDSYYQKEGTNEANVRAKTLIHLLENKLI